MDQYVLILETALIWVFILAPIWLPVVLFVIFTHLWMTYIHLWYVFKKFKPVLLEIKIPREVNKSPRAMEMLFNYLYQKGSATYIETYWDGKIPPWYSFEIASFAGEIHFYIWTPGKFKNIIESQLYAQYPGVEIGEAKEDYTLPVTHHADQYSMWITYFKKKMPDAYPIRTYVDYEMHENPKEEFKIDPMSSVLEFLGSLKQGEQVWLQIMIQANREEALAQGRLFKRPDWTKAAKAEIKKLKDSLKSSKDEGGYPRIPTKGESDVINAIERSLSKYAFDATIRGAYIAKPDSFNADNITGLIGTFVQYNSLNLNNFKLGKFTDVDYPWEDWRGTRVRNMKKKYLEAYKLRSFFQPPYKYHMQKPFILTSEELATIFHLPSATITTPTVGRIMSKKSEAPANLPI